MRRRSARSLDKTIGLLGRRTVNTEPSPGSLLGVAEKRVPEIVQHDPKVRESPFDRWIRARPQLSIHRERWSVDRHRFSSRDLREYLTQIKALRRNTG
jgi:hypothetical protein